MCSFIHSLDDSSDEDIWAYKSSKRKKEVGCFRESQASKGKLTSIIARESPCQTQSPNQTQIARKHESDSPVSTVENKYSQHGKRKNLRMSQNNLSRTRTTNKHYKRQSIDTESNAMSDSVNEVLFRCEQDCQEPCNDCNEDNHFDLPPKQHSAKATKNHRLKSSFSSQHDSIPSSSSATPSQGQLKVDEYCPMCQMPFCALSSLDSPRSHVTECMDLPMINSQECGDGIKCSNTIPSHYRKFKHSKLAQQRSGIDDNKNYDQKTGVQEHGQTEHSMTENTANATTSPYFKSAPHSCPPESLRDRSSKDTGVRRSLAEGFEEQTIHIINRMCPTGESELDSEVMDDSAGSDTDIFNNDSNSMNCMLHRGESTKQQADIGSESIEEVYRDVSDLIAEAVSDDDMSFDGRGKTGSAIESRHQTSLKLDDGNESSDSVVCTGSSMKENSFNLTPLTPELTPIASSLGSSMVTKSDFMKLLTPKSSQVTPCKRKSSSKARKGASQNKTPKKHNKITLGSTKIGSSQKIKTAAGSEARSKVMVAGNKALKKQASVLSFFQPLKKETTEVDLEPKNSDVLKPSNSLNSEDIHTTVAGVSSLTNPGSILDVADDGNIGNSGNKSTSSTVSSRSWSMARQSTINPGPILGANVNIVSNVSAHGNSSKPASSTTGNISYSKAMSSGFRKTCPFYKKIPGTPFTVDAFQYGTIPGCKAYFLSHFHYDHYQGLRKTFQHPIYCSHITANLVQKKIGVNVKNLRSLSLNQRHDIEGVEVTLLEANHCPGSVLFLYKLPNGQTILHTGDFRANDEMEQYPELQGVSIHQLYLDTTYCDPTYTFPPQQEVVQFAVDVATKFIYENPNGIIVVGSYTIGKERIFQAIAETLGCKICVTREKLNILSCFDDESMNSRLTLKGDQAKVHILPMKSLNYKDLEGYLEKYKVVYDKVLAFEPTGWTHSKKTLSLQQIKPKIQRGSVTLYGIPYSEHSSYTEMKRFVQFLRPARILPTVNNGNAQSRKKMEAQFSMWLKEERPGKSFKQSALNNWITSPAK